MGFLAFAFTPFGWLVIVACLIALMAVGTALFYLWPILVLGIVGYLVVRYKKKHASEQAGELTGKTSESTDGVTAPQSSSPEPPR